MAESAFSDLGVAKLMSLTTFRKSGEPVSTPVWVARDGDLLVVVTNPNVIAPRRPTPSLCESGFAERRICNVQLVLTKPRSRITSRPYAQRSRDSQQPDLSLSA